MHCPLKSGEGNDLFIARSARALSPDAHAALEQHLAVCQDCRHMAEAQDRVWSTLDAWEPVPASPRFDEQLYAKIAAEDDMPSWRRALETGFPAAWSWKPAMPVAAACAVLLLAFLSRSPLTEHRTQLIGQPSVQPRVDIEQVERTLDDMDMLSQLGLAAGPPPARASGRASI